MFKKNLGLTTKLAFGLSTLLILFLSSSFISLAKADEAIPPLPTFGDMQGTDSSDLDSSRINCEKGKIMEQLRDNEDEQAAYRERWQERKSRYRLIEEYAAWLRDHEEPGSGHFGPAGFGQYVIPLPTFFDIIMNVF
jgi:hypothetical protein